MEHGEPTCGESTSIRECLATDVLDILLVDEEGKPMPGVAYVVDIGGIQYPGFLNRDGWAQVTGIPKGQCVGGKVTFPDLDADAWEPSP
jgi:hypothetical protein